MEMADCMVEDGFRDAGYEYVNMDVSLYRSGRDGEGEKEGGSD